MTLDQAHKAIFDWGLTATEEELVFKISGLQFLGFSGQHMTLKPGTHIYDYFVSVPIIHENNEIEGGLDVETLGLSIALCRFKVSRLRKSQGRYNPRKRMIIISSTCLEDTSILLHEMIHAYECILLERGKSFEDGMILRDLLTHFLYKSLSKEIKNLDEIIHDFIHVRWSDDKIGDGGFHSLLFLLKSLDLYLRLKLKLGTVFGYGSDRYINPNDTGEEI